ncbi:TPA: hypothetical protein JI109_02930 [Acinetobacter baumannii]|nr:hypothetical protein [Acinetobacter baumannii]
MKVNNLLQTHLIFESLLLINQKKAFKTYLIHQFYSFYLCFLYVFLDEKNFRTKTILFYVYRIRYMKNDWTAIDTHSITFEMD